MKNLYTANVTVTSGRDGSANSSDGRLALRLGFPKELGGAGDATNPEQLFAAGFAACFASSVKAAAKSLSVPIDEVKVQAEATLSVREDGSYLVSHVVLTVQADGMPVGAEKADAVLAEAKRICAYSNATRANTTVDVVLT